MNRGAWWSTVHGVATKPLSTHTHTHEKKIGESHSLIQKKSIITRGKWVSGKVIRGCYVMESQ